MLSVFHIITIVGRSSPQIGTFEAIRTHKFNNVNKVGVCLHIPQSLKLILFVYMKVQTEPISGPSERWFKFL